MQDRDGIARTSPRQATSWLQSREWQHWQGSVLQTSLKTVPLVTRLPAEQ